MRRGREDARVRCACDQDACRSCSSEAMLDNRRDQLGHLGAIDLDALGAAGQPARSEDDVIVAATPTMTLRQCTDVCEIERKILATGSGFVKVGCSKTSHGAEYSARAADAANRQSLLGGCLLGVSSRRSL